MAVRGGQRVTSQTPEGTYEALEKYGRDLTALTQQGGERARWFPEATNAAYAVLDELARERGGDTTWRWVSRRLSRW